MALDCALDNRSMLLWAMPMAGVAFLGASFRLLPFL